MLFVAELQLREISFLHTIKFIGIKRIQDVATAGVQRDLLRLHFGAQANRVWYAVAHLDNSVASFVSLRCPSGNT